MDSPILVAWGKASLFEEFTAEENVFQEVEITSLLQATRVFDVYRVVVRKRSPPERAEEQSAIVLSSFRE